MITTPYTFAASILPILLAGALPVFADIDAETWQIDPAKIEPKINNNTVAILPVHIIGGICDMDRIGAIAKRRNLKVIEDACEAHGGEWQNRKAGTFGDLGCFSFQNAKALTCGEGGAILGSDAKLMDRCFSFHNLGRPHGGVGSAQRQGHPILGAKCRMAEYQASILLTQMQTFEEESWVRSENAVYLTNKLKQIPGIIPRNDYPGVTRTAFYYYGFRYKKEQFAGVSRQKFIAALRAEGVSASSGLGVIEGKAMNKEGFLEDAFRSKAYQRIYPKEKLATITPRINVRYRTGSSRKPWAFIGRVSFSRAARTWTTSRMRSPRFTRTGTNWLRQVNSGGSLLLSGSSRRTGVGVRQAASRELSPPSKS